MHKVIFLCNHSVLKCKAETSWREIREEFDLNATVFYLECLVYKIFATETNFFLLHSQEHGNPDPDS